MNCTTTTFDQVTTMASNGLRCKVFGDQATQLPNFQTYISGFDCNFVVFFQADMEHNNMD
jgi:hypothetical protein